MSGRPDGHVVGMENVSLIEALVILLIIAVPVAVVVGVAVVIARRGRIRH